MFLRGNKVRRKLGLFVGAVLAAATVLTFGAASSMAQEIVCPDNLKNWSALKTGDKLSCVCNNRQRRNSVWGGPRYTADSSICRAAVHAGVIPPSGGKVTLYLAAGCSTFKGSVANGVRAGRWGAYGRTFTFTPQPGACDIAAAVGPCPSSMSAYRKLPTGRVLRCTCDPSQYRGSVWGSGRYTADSSICRAALHAGVLSKSGGTVSVRTAPGCPMFRGSRRNGVSTGNWNSYPMTFVFAGQSPGCAR